MSAGPLLSDELVRQMVAVGQVDVLVGVPTYNHADTVAQVVKAVHVAFARHFPRQRTLLVNSDGSSADGTPEVVRGATLDESETLVARHALRTIHRISAPYHGVPGEASGIRVVFTAAELLQARAVAILDPEVVSITPEWVARLVEPVLADPYDFVAPIHARHRFEALLSTQLVRPLFCAAFGTRVREPLAGEFACSGRFVAHALAQDDLWEAAGEGAHLGLLASALAGGFRVGQAHLGARVLAERPRAALPELFRQVMGSLLACMKRHEAWWLARAEITDEPALGTPLAPAGEEPPVDIASLADAFRSGVRDLEPLLSAILTPEVLDAVRRCAAREPGARCVPDELWVRTVCDSAAAWRRAAMSQEHVIMAQVPLYRGRAASFAAAHAGEDREAVERHIEALRERYEQAKPYLVQRWQPEAGR
jgi:hypothetical protein